MKIVGILRIKNAILTISECLYNLSALVDEIVIVDNGSTDGTIQTYNYFPKIVTVKKTRGYNEARDKNLVHQLGKKRNPDWMVFLDADEVFESALTRSKLEGLCSSSHDALGIRIFHFWLSKTHFRADDYYFTRYTTIPFPRIFKNTDYIYFDKKKRIHSWFAKGYKNLKDVKYRIKHYGFIYPEQIKGKVDLYESLKFPEDENDYLSYKKPISEIKLTKWRSANFPGGEIFLNVVHWYWRIVEFFFNNRRFFRRLKYNLYKMTGLRKNLLFYLYKLSLRSGLHQLLETIRKTIKKQF